MRISKITVAGVAAAAMIASGAGLAAASTTTIHRPAVSGTEHFSLMTTQPSASKYTIIATGVFTAGGIDRAGSAVDVVKLPAGSFKISHTGPVHIIKQQLNPRTCFMQIVVSGKFTIGSGTGAYKKLTGSGKALISVIGIARRAKGHCDPNATPVVLEQTITGTAHVTL